MANLNGFNAQNVDPTNPFEPLAPGKYLAVITESEMKKTKSGTGEYLQLAFQVVEGPCKNRKVWARLNLRNQNTTTRKIAESELSAICRAVGVLEPKDSVELHNLPLLITVTQKARTDTGEMTNEIKGYARKEAAKGQPQQADTVTPPWGRQ